jgi:hypothetical protein
MCSEVMTGSRWRPHPIGNTQGIEDDEQRNEDHEQGNENNE